jgi:WhiB family redox-sensing transcriptional regulator
MARTTSLPIGKNAQRSRGASLKATETDPIVDEIRRLPPPITAQWDWQLRAACRGMDSAWFFPPEREQMKARSSRLAKAKAVCARCPALAECRDFALANGESFGVWGGLSEDDREKGWPDRATG